MFAFAFVRPPAAAAQKPNKSHEKEKHEMESQVGAVQFTVCRYVVLAVELLHLQGRKARPIEVHPLHRLCCGGPCAPPSAPELREKLDELVQRAGRSSSLPSAPRSGQVRRPRVRLCL